MKLLTKRATTGYMITSWFDKELTDRAAFHFMHFSADGKMYNCSGNDLPTVFLDIHAAEDALLSSLKHHERNYGKPGPSRIIKVMVRS